MAPLKYEGCSLFRNRITASLLSGNTLKVNKIREKDDSPGLQDYEANYLKLIEKLTDGEYFVLVDCSCW
jgi:RNA 3'-terminal phosphate cyclase-like protein